MTLNNLPLTLSADFLRNTMEKAMLIFKGTSTRGHPKYEFTESRGWIDIVDGLPPEFQGKKVSVAITVIVKDR